jgi:hypothetical protein
MPSSRIIAVAFGAATLIGAALSVAPAGAAPVSAGNVQTSQADGGLVQQAWHYGRPHYRAHRGFYGRPVYRPRCFFTNRRVWTGYGWVVRPVRVCR